MGYRESEGSRRGRYDVEAREEVRGRRGHF